MKHWQVTPQQLQEIRSVIWMLFMSNCKIINSEVLELCSVDDIKCDIDKSEGLLQGFLITDGELKFFLSLQLNQLVQLEFYRHLLCHLPWCLLLECAYLNCSCRNSKETWYAGQAASGTPSIQLSMTNQTFLRSINLITCVLFWKAQPVRWYKVWL